MPDTSHAEPGAIAHGDAAADRSRVKLGQQRLVFGQRIGDRRFGTGPKPPADQQTTQPADDAAGGLLDLYVGRRWESAEAGRPALLPFVDAIEDDGVIGLQASDAI